MLEREGDRRSSAGRIVLSSRMVSGASGLRELRAEVLRSLELEQVPAARYDDIALAVHEIATNAIVHGGGWSRVQISADGRSWVCDVMDGGPGLDDPEPGTREPGLAEGGFGLWIARHACDEFCVLPSKAGLHVRLVVNTPQSPR